jgi:murein L,D-transpeptidase YcbB/YkuD
MHAGEEKQVSLKEPLPVHIFYFTAWVDDTGALHLEKDIYGYDTP